MFTKHAPAPAPIHVPAHAPTHALVQILVLDEATSALDSITEKSIQVRQQGPGWSPHLG